MTRVARSAPQYPAENPLVNHTTTKVFDISGKLVSQKREELVHILDQFNVQVDNPVAILNQDTSRNFLHSSKPQDKYKVWCCTRA
jgi:uncharacterized protein YxjI